MTETKPYVIVLGNEKGGTGKSTTAIHIAVSLLKSGFQVATIDIDARQGTLTRYFENRARTAQSRNLGSGKLPQPIHYPILASNNTILEDARLEDRNSIASVFVKVQGCDFIVVDTPGHDLYLSRLAHSYADTLITPLNDSFVDLDVIGHIEADTFQVQRPSLYAEWVFEQKKQRAMRDRGSIDWIVMRNRLTNINAKNKENMETALVALSKRIGFRLVSGFGERVIFRELFLNGLTLLDLPDIEENFSLSHVAARQELRALLRCINLPTGLQSRLQAS